MRSPYLATIVVGLLSACTVLAQSGGETSSPGPSPAAIAPTLPPASDPVLSECLERFWFSADYLLWWIQKAPLATNLVTTDPSNGATPTAGGLADPTTIGVLGGSGVRFNPLSGGRLQAGWMLGDSLAIEAGGLFTGKQTEHLQAASDANGNPLFLFRPFVNVDTGNLNAGSFVALPGIIAGSVVVDHTSEIWGADIRLAGGRLGCETNRLDWLVGFRYLDLYEKLDINDSRIDLAGIGNFGGPATVPGDRFLIQDSFHTRNQFYGGQIGVRGESCFGRLILSGTAKVSLGDSRQVVAIQGLTTLTTAAGGSASLPGGILALPSNSGHFVHHEFAVVPEVGVQIGLNLTERLRVAIGYDFLYWSSVVRPGDQVVPVVSASQLPTSPSFGSAGPSVPPPSQNRTDFWLQGINVGVVLHF